MHDISRVDFVQTAERYVRQLFCDIVDGQLRGVRKVFEHNSPRRFFDALHKPRVVGDARKG